MTGVESRVEVTEARVRERPLEPIASDANGEDAFLIWLRPPAAAIHHPQERGFDPRHPINLER